MPKFIRSFKALRISIVALALLCLYPDYANSQVLLPVEDAFVRNGSYAGDNYGADVTLQCKTASDGFTRYTFIKYDLSAIKGRIVGATLRLKVAQTNGAGDTHHIRFVSDDSWRESTLTWNNKPEADGKHASAVHPNEGQWLELDVTELAEMEKNGDQILSLVLTSDGSNHVRYHAKESASSANHPQLVVHASDDSTAPSPPTNVSATAQSYDQINLSWDKNSEADLSHYAIKRAFASDGTFLDIAGTSETFYDDIGLLPSTLYFYVVTAVDSALNESEPSDIASATTLDPPEIPAAPFNLTATTVSSYQINLSWSDSSDIEDGFFIERKSSGTFEDIAQVDQNTVEFQDSFQLQPLTTFTYRVRAFNAGGQSDYSNEAVATTDSARTYFVDATNGNDANDGLSPATAWRSLAKVSSIIFAPGDHILLKRNQVWNERLSLHGSGVEGYPIIVDAYGAGNKPVINGGGGAGNPSDEPAVLLQNVEHWEINNLFITHTDGSRGYQGDLWGIRVNATVAGEFNHIYIRDCIIEKVNGAVSTKTTGGIYVTVESGPESPAWFNDLKIQNNRIGHPNNLQDTDGVVGGLGIATRSSHGAFSLGDKRKPFKNVLISNNIVGPTGRNNIIIRVSDDAVVQHNRLIQSSIYEKGHSVFCFNTRNVQIQYNEAYGNVGPASESDHGGFDADYNCYDTKIQYNYSHDNNWGFGIMKRAVNENVVIRYNISENDKVAIYFYGFDNETGLTDAHIYNNTHYVAEDLNVRVFRDRTALNSRFINNIFYFQESGSWGSASPRSCTFENNCYFNITPKGTDYITADPLFTDPGQGGQDIDWSHYPNVLKGYHLAETSPAVNAGKPIDNNGGQDFWGNALYFGAPDIGAHEHPEASGLMEPEHSPTLYALMQNYPNPFNPSTHIQFQLPESAHVDFTIYSLSGRAVRSLQDESRLSAGLHSVTWDGRDDSGQNAASGVYIYRLKATGVTTGAMYHSNRKMLLLK